jgi:formylglycine-generating enzyme
VRRLFAALLSLTGCATVVGADFSGYTERETRGEGGAGGTMGVAGSSGSSSGMGEGGASGAPGTCTSAGQCPSMTCMLASCPSGTCEYAPLLDGEQVPGGQTPNDCKKIVCDGSGATRVEMDPLDLPESDGHPCTDEVCDGPTPSTSFVEAGRTCDTASVCTGKGVCADCVPGDVRCQPGAAGVQETCDEVGQWKSSQCPASAPVCSAGACVPPDGPSCAGNLSCHGVSCCESRLVPAATYLMGRSDDGTDAYASGAPFEQPEHSVSTSDFHLDTFEVTLGRFRRFVDAYDAWRADGNPKAGAGQPPHIPDGGWPDQASDWLPADRAALVTSVQCNPSGQLFTEGVSDEILPINCVTWYTAFAFCLWDGGRLPTEAEWENAAAGGVENRLFPWGQELPDQARASFACLHDADINCSFPDIAPVGSLPAGAGRFGHHDLGGNLTEWTLDWFTETWYGTGGQSCSDCANTSDSMFFHRSRRGGGWTSTAFELRAAYRSGHTASDTGPMFGVRCAR